MKTYGGEKNYGFCLYCNKARFAGLMSVCFVTDAGDVEGCVCWWSRGSWQDEGKVAQTWGLGETVTKKENYVVFSAV